MPQIPLRHAQTAFQGSNAGTCTKPVPQTPAQAGLRAPGRATVWSGASPLQETRPALRARRGPAAPRPPATLRPVTPGSPALPAPGRVPTWNLPATLTRARRNRGGRPARLLQRRRGRARGGAGRGNGFGPPGNSLWVLLSFRKRERPLLVSSRPGAGASPAAGLTSSPLTTGQRQISENEFTALLQVETHLPELHDQLRQEGRPLNFRRKWRVQGSGLAQSARLWAWPPPAVGTVAGKRGGGTSGT